MNEGPARGRRKQPWLIRRRDRRPFLAGRPLRTVDRTPDGSEVEKLCLLTTAPNGWLPPIMAALPVILPAGLKRPGWRLPMARTCGPWSRLLGCWDPQGWEALPLGASFHQLDLLG